jgi:hypothetical protein
MTASLVDLAGTREAPETTPVTPDKRTTEALCVLDEHYRSFQAAKPFAVATGHTVPCDTKSWSQVLVSALTGLSGRNRKKGSDLDDGSDVKGANTWDAIDTPRFNGCIPAGRITHVARKPGDVRALDDEPHIFFVLWDEMGESKTPRCRVWCVRAQHDSAFRAVCSLWYERRSSGTIKSENFQLHPPRNRDNNVIRNTCGNLEYPLLFCAVRSDSGFKLDSFNPGVLKSGQCKVAEEVSD